MPKLGGSEGQGGTHTHGFDEAGGYDAPAVGNEAVLTSSGSIRERGQKDATMLTDLDRKELDIKPEENLRYIRNPHTWESHEFSNRFYDFRRDHPSARIPIDANGQSRNLGDTILVAYNKADDEERDAELEQGKERYLAEIDNHPDSFQRPTTKDEIREFQEHVEAQWQAYMDAGMIGPKSPTHGLDYNSARARYSDDQVTAEETRFRAGATHVDYDDEQWKADIDRYQQKMNRQGTPGRQHAFSGVGFAENKRPGSGQGRSTTRGS